MKFLVQWSLPHATFRPAVARFLKGGGLPPAGVTLVGRWHGMSGKGCAVVDTTDAKLLYAWIAEWSEFLPLETTPVLEDADAGTVLGSIYKERGSSGPTPTTFQPLTGVIPGAAG